MRTHLPFGIFSFFGLALTIGKDVLANPFKRFVIVLRFEPIALFESRSRIDRGSRPINAYFGRSNTDECYFAL